LLDVKGAEIAFSPGFRFGPTLLPGQAITFENVMDMTAISYPETEVKDMTGSDIKNLLEEHCDQVFNPDPYQQHGGDMLRVGGLNYTCDPNKSKGSRISNLVASGKTLEASKKYKVASWGLNSSDGQAVWEVVATWMKDKKAVRSSESRSPQLAGVENNPGVSL
jgi:sulfur-oxidizing protein SoxB